MLLPVETHRAAQASSWRQLWDWLLSSDTEDQGTDTPGPEFGRPEQGVSADEEAFGYGNPCPSG